LPTGASLKALEGNDRLPLVMKGYSKLFAPKSSKRLDSVDNENPHRID
jgi:hypothetical protein